MTWIDKTASDDLLRTWVRQCPALKLATSIDGRVLWANLSFLEWSQYRLSEIVRLTIDELNGVGGVSDDLGELETQSAVVQRIQLRPNGEAAQWGHLTRMRYPLSGNMECFLCTWEPIKPSTAEAFSLALEHSVRVDAKLGEMTTELKKLTHQTDEENWVLSSFRIMQSHPKMAMVFLIVALSVMGLNNVVGLLQRMGVVSLPVKIEKVQTHAAFDYEIAFMGLNKANEKTNAKQRPEVSDQGSAEIATAPARIEYETAGGSRFTLVSGGGRIEPAESWGHMPRTDSGRDRGYTGNDSSRSGSTCGIAGRLSELSTSLNKRAATEH